jgi:LCP family protein required for cell wall assembly
MTPHPSHSARDSLVLAVLFALAAVIVGALFLVVRGRGLVIGGAAQNDARGVVVAINPTVIAIATIPPVARTATPRQLDATTSGAPTPTIPRAVTSPTADAQPTGTPTRGRPPVLALPGLTIPDTPPPAGTTPPDASPAVSVTFTPYPTDPPQPYRQPGVDDDVLNILLIGSDQRPDDMYYRTDTLLIVSINRSAQTVAMLSIPRDLYVNIPGHGLDRINTAFEYGEIQKVQGGGIRLLKDTVARVTGITIQRYARIDFSGFKQVVDTIGGIDIANDCPLSDYRLAPGLKEGVEANYRWSTLPVGVFHFGGVDALWYARSRMTTSDFDRARRQQAVLRAIYRKAFEGGLLGKLPAVWPDLSKLVSTDLTLADLVSLVPLASELDASRMRSYVIGPPAVTDFTTDSGAEVLIPQQAAINAIVARFNTPPTSNALFAEKPTIEIWNNSSHNDWDDVAAARLAWEGFVPLLKGKWAGDAATDTATAKLTGTTLYDFTGKAKPASLGALSRILALRSRQVMVAPDPNAATDFRLIIGDDYASCTYRVGG